MSTADMEEFGPLGFEIRPFETLEHLKETYIGKTHAEWLERNTEESMKCP